MKAVGIKVVDSELAYTLSVANGAEGILRPTLIVDRCTQKSIVISEIKLFGDTVLRWISGDYEGPFLPNYELVDTPDINYGRYLFTYHLLVSS